MWARDKLLTITDWRTHSGGIDRDFFASGNGFFEGLLGLEVDIGVHWEHPFGEGNNYGVKLGQDGKIGLVGQIKVRIFLIPKSAIIPLIYLDMKGYRYLPTIVYIVVNGAIRVLRSEPSLLIA